ncbi:MAG TPA: thiopurine S-methyltransferase [Rhodanobacteraceae bacterium]|nr:thiopurine S-methyltransferase [Rhodanobacteraceae bacterium]
MDADFWLQRWDEGRTGWHRDAVMPLLEQHWPALGVLRGTRVLVPLCGKSLDMPWLAAQGLHVRGVELAPLAVDQFFAAHDLQPHVREAAYGTHYRTGEIEIVRADVFEVDAAQFAECDAIYDRAALIALPPPMRERYARSVYGALPAGCRGLLITLEYPQHQMEGPPFSVEEREVHRLFGEHWDIDLLERRDILDSQPSFSQQGVTALHTAVYRLQKRLAP